MRSLSAMNVRRFCNEIGIRARTTLDDSEIEREVTKSITEVISKFLRNIKNKILFYSERFSRIYLLSCNNKSLIKILLLIYDLYHVLRLVKITEEK